MLHKVFLALLFSFIVVAGCSDKPASEPQETAAADEQAATETTVNTEATVNVESTNEAYTAAGDIDWSSIGTQQATLLSNSDQYSICFIYIANFETDGNLANVELEPGQAVAYFVLRQPESDLPIAGQYNLTTPDTDFGGSASIRLATGSTLMMYVPAMTVGDLEITDVSDAKVTGTFNAADRWTEMSGSFQADII